MTYQARTRRSEGFTNLAGIARAFKVYHAEQGRYPDIVHGRRPASLPAPGSGQPKHGEDVLGRPTEDFFKIVGWRPDGNVFYSYEVESHCFGGGCTDAELLHHHRARRCRRRRRPRR